MKIVFSVQLFLVGAMKTVNCTVSCQVLTGAAKAIDMDNPLVRAHFPQYFELSFRLLAPEVGEEKCIFALEHDSAATVLGLFSSDGPDRPLQLFYLGFAFDGPDLRADYQTAWVTITIRYTSTMISIDLDGDSRSYTTAANGVLPVAPWDAVLYFSYPVEVTAGGSVSDVIIRGT
jgi:hypothetical protein